MEEGENYLGLSSSPIPEGRRELLAKLLGTQLSEVVYIINYLTSRSTGYVPMMSIGIAVVGTAPSQSHGCGMAEPER
jgi:hypothetical protein